MVKGAETHFKPMSLAVWAGLGAGDSFSVALDHFMADLPLYQPLRAKARRVNSLHPRIAAGGGGGNDKSRSLQKG